MRWLRIYITNGKYHYKTGMCRSFRAGRGGALLHCFLQTGMKLSILMPVYNEPESEWAAAPEQSHAG